MLAEIHSMIAQTNNNLGDLIEIANHISADLRLQEQHQQKNASYNFSGQQGNALAARSVDDSDEETEY